MISSVPKFVEDFEFQPGQTVGSLLRTAGASVLYQPIGNVPVFREVLFNRHAAARAGLDSTDTCLPTRQLLALSQAVLSFLDSTAGNTLYLLIILDRHGLGLLSLVADHCSKRIVLISVGAYEG